MNIILFAICLIAFLYSTYKMVALRDQLNEDQKLQIRFIQRSSAWLYLGLVTLTIIALIIINSLISSAHVANILLWAGFIIFELLLVFGLRKFLVFKMTEYQLTKDYINKISRYVLICYGALILFFFTIFDVPW